MSIGSTSDDPAAGLEVDDLVNSPVVTVNVKRPPGALPPDGGDAPAEPGAGPAMPPAPERR